MKTLLTLLPLILLLSSFQNSRDYIFWSETVELDWSDFRGPYYTANANIEQNPIRAQTAAIISIGFRKLGYDSIMVISRAAFDPNRSSVKYDSRIESVLLHERLHFDIAEVFCRRIKKAIAEKKQFSRKTAEKEIRKIANGLQASYTREQAAFDRAPKSTDFLTTRYVQWKEKVSAELAELAPYRSSAVVVALVD